MAGQDHREERDADGTEGFPFVGVSRVGLVSRELATARSAVSTQELCAPVGKDVGQFGVGIARMLMLSDASASGSSAIDASARHRVHG